ncbi:hypothetical protein BOTBODRAFT_182289 [Botryobasidium botryosum FD-172 SS1]|uniref:Uncharacterized protein n=1 Tax=Botryobasidium botryosum (strain FD-172 SS1) TaxID=930990 RepID=A0A067LR63_BOTB1|nr:hypothetical protein BOTBODRAFT_182289 [Botryobasidium botryosum FD-172 SS1]
MSSTASSSSASGDTTDTDPTSASSTDTDGPPPLEEVHSDDDHVMPFYLYIDPVVWRIQRGVVVHPIAHAGIADRVENAAEVEGEGSGTGVDAEASVDTPPESTDHGYLADIEE